MLKQKPVGHISDLVTHNGMVQFHQGEFELKQIQDEGAKKVKSSAFTTEKCMIRLYDQLKGLARDL